MKLLCWLGWHVWRIEGTVNLLGRSYPGEARHCIECGRAERWASYVSYPSWEGEWRPML